MRLHISLAHFSTASENITPLHDAVTNEHIDIVKVNRKNKVILRIEIESLVQLLLAGGADVGCVNIHGQSALDMSDNAEILKLLERTVSVLNQVFYFKLNQIMLRQPHPALTSLGVARYFHFCLLE